MKDGHYEKPGCCYSDHEIQPGYVITFDPTDSSGNRNGLHTSFKNR